jgi:kumamolisin
MSPLPLVAGVVLAGTASAAAQPLVAVPQDTGTAHAQARVADFAAADQISVSVGLKPHNEAGLDQFLAQVSDPASALFRHYLTPEQYAAQYGPTAADVATVTDFLTANGLKVSGVTGGLVVDATGSASQVEHAFNTRIGVYKANDDRDYYANDATPTLPANVASVVSGVTGLDNYAVRHPDAVKTPQKTSPHAPAGFGPSTLHGAYNTGSLGTGSGQTVALWEFDGYQTKNISAYDKQFGLKSTAPKTVSVDGANYDSSPGGGQPEVELDIEIVQAMASAANTLVYEAPNSDQGQIDMAAKIVADKKASVVSISWGACEADQGSSAITGTDNALKKGAAEGISFYSASGDSGSADCQSGATGVDYPASDPSVSGVGGTTLTVGSGGAWKSETAWSGSGGGVSTVYKAPSWEKGVNGMRTVPDVSSDADPNTGYAVYTGGSWQEYGGTSCAAPMWAGFTAHLGNGNPVFAKIGAGSSYAKAFHDITSGSNGKYKAGKGYDEVTGWGSYNGANLEPLL